MNQAPSEPRPDFSVVVRRLLSVIQDASLSTDLLTTALGDAGLQALNMGLPAGALQALDRSDVSAHDRQLVKLIVLREPATLSTWEGVLNSQDDPKLVQDALVVGVITPLGVAAFPSHRHPAPTPEFPFQLALDIRPYVFEHFCGTESGDAATDATAASGEFLLASDADEGLWVRKYSPSDLVPGVGNAARSLIRVLPPKDNPWLPEPKKVLDLGCGGGVLSVAIAKAYPDAHVVGTDISERALAFARANSRVADADSIEWRQGSWFEPVTGDDGSAEQFDLIVSNPPFVIQPPTVNHVYRDSGLALDGATEKVISTVTEHLTPGGTAHILSAWALQEDNGVASKINEWIPSDGARVNVQVRQVVDPATYVHTWLADESVDPRSPEGRNRASEWLRYLSRKSVTHIALGFTHIQKIDGPSEVTVEELPAHMAPGTPLGQDVAEWFARSQWLADAESRGADISDARFVVRPCTAIETVLLADDKDGIGFVDHDTTLCRTDGPAWRHEIDSHVTAILSGLSAEGLPLEDVVELYAAVNGVDSAELLEQATAIIVDLIRHGIVLPSDLGEYATDTSKDSPES